MTASASTGGIAADGDNPAKMWAAFRSWMTADAEWEIMMNDLRRVLTLNFGSLDHLPRVVSAGDTWSSTSKVTSPPFRGVVEIGYQHDVERIDDAPRGQQVSIVSTSTGGVSGTNVDPGESSGTFKKAAYRSAGVFDVSLGMVTKANTLASGELDVGFRNGAKGTLAFRYESSTTCRQAGK